jgi:glutamate-ammonia-ligase adenylyltransferase
MTQPTRPEGQRPASVANAIAFHWHNIEEAMREAELAERFQSLISVTGDDAQQQRYGQLCELLAASDYAGERITRKPRTFIELIDAGLLDRAYAPGELAQRLREILTGCIDEKDLMPRLRLFRHQEMVRILWRDLNRLAPLPEIMQDLTDLADASIDESLTLLYAWTAAVSGTPLDANGQPMPLVVFGMGKHGARELNLSSDIDLMFSYAEDGETQGGSRSISHQEFFTKLGQKLIKALNETTGDGFVFRVDMRLRPYGDSGALALSFAAMETYYEEQGREWERYAMIKARAVGSDNGDGARLLKNLRPFVYRRYVDFGVIESLREMKGMIHREVLRRGNEENIKTGAGGIREIEFIVQALQLIRGGQEPQLREPQMLTVMPRLQALGVLPEDMVNALREAYIFLRETEHRIQALKDKQTQLLPVDAAAQERLAWSQGFATWPEFYARLQQVRDSVSEYFGQFISGGEEETEASIPEAASALWQQELSDEESNTLFSSMGYQDCTELTRRLKHHRNSRIVGQMQATARQRLDKLMPMLIAACAKHPNNYLALLRCLPLVENILRRSAYMALLVENPKSLEHLAQLFASSAWLAETMTSHPFLLDGLLNAATLFAPPKVDQLKDELRQQMLRVPEDDLERQMETLRQFKLAHVLRVAASDISGTLPIMKVSDYLTWLAETLLQTVFDLAWRQMVEKHGIPEKSPGVLCSPDFIIVGYGKVGGIELSYSSDLDLVFVHDADPNLYTDGERSIDNSTFFARLGQRIIHLLTTRTPTGQLYETDMRLRPSGNSGLLVTSLRALDKYQRETAWTWEHQALVRARVVAGCPQLRGKFEQLRRDILATHREPEKLAQEVADMRKKMAEHLSKAHNTELDEASLTADHSFELKQDPGGIVDIEFLAQFLVLRHAEQYPDMAVWTDNVRIFETAERLGILAPEDARILHDAYLAYREHTHRAGLQNEKGAVSADQFVDYRKAIRRIWHSLVA